MGFEMVHYFEVMKLPCLVYTAHTYSEDQKRHSLEYITLTQWGSLYSVEHNDRLPHNNNNDNIERKMGEKEKYREEESLQYLRIIRIKQGKNGIVE